MTTPKKTPAATAEGKALELLGICSHLGITLTDLAAHCDISRTAMSRIAGANTWPVQDDRGRIQRAVLAYLEANGATAEMLGCAFAAAYTKRQPWGSRPGGISLEPPKPLTYLNPKTPTRHPDSEDADMLLPKQTLTPEARRHFKAFVNPFDGEVTTEAQMFTGGDVAYLREACWQAAQTASFLALVGESGSGKTTVLGDLEARIESEARHCIIFRPSVLGMEDNDTRGKALKSADILHAIITALDPVASVPQTLQARTLKAGTMLKASAEAGNTHLLVIEEAHSLPDATLKHLKRLHEMRAGRRPLMGILLLAHQELKLRLDAGLRGGHLREVAQRVEIIQMLPLDTELGAYLTHRAKSAGRALGDFIEPDGVEALRAKLTRTVAGNGGKGRTVSMTYPLAVNNLVTRCLNEAAAIGAPRITRDVVLAV